MAGEYIISEIPNLIKILSVLAPVLACGIATKRIKVGTLEYDQETYIHDHDGEKLAYPAGSPQKYNKKIHGRITKWYDEGDVIPGELPDGRKSIHRHPLSPLDSISSIGPWEYKWEHKNK